MSASSTSTVCKPGADAPRAPAASQLPLRSADVPVFGKPSQHIRLENRESLGYAPTRMSPQVAIDQERVRQFCERWRVTELALFGSVLTEAFGPASDIDVLVTFAPDAPWTLFDMVRMREELKQMFGREVDLVSRGGLEASRNYLRRNGILSSAKVIHAARP